MIQLPEDRRPPLTPQLALRVTVLGGFALAMFAIIFFRLWFLQVLSGEQYVAQARTNRTREIAIPAPRGEVIDSSGQVLVNSTPAIAIELSPDQLPVPIETSEQYLHPPRRDLTVYRRLDPVLGMSRKPARCVVTPKTVVHGVAKPAVVARLAEIPCVVAQQLSQLPYAFVTLKTVASNDDVYYYLEERQNEFPGVQVQKVHVRNYPDGTLAAQLFGTVGRVTPYEATHPRCKGISDNDVIGQSGLEYTYNCWLQGTDGAERVQINSLGQFTKTLKTKPATPGDNLQLSLNAGLQRVGQNALQQSIESNPPADGGAFVAMNPENGAIYGMGSLPTFNPNVFTKPISQSEYNKLFGPGAGSPQLNRAIQSAGPTGSTFKLITATAALQSGAWSVDQTFDDTGQFCEGTLCRKNSGGAAYGDVNMVSAIKVSDDVFFYNLGALTNSDAPQGGALQQWAKLYGIGQPTGVDLPGEAAGTLPSPAWRAHENELEVKCDNLTHPTSEFPNHPDHKLAPGGCGLVVWPPESWTIGDNVNMAVGQGDVQVTPLQLAVAYSAMANDGTIVTPHVGEDVQNADGTVVQRFDPPPKRHIPINPLYRQTIMDGLRAAASQPGGTSADVFGNFPQPVYGKTGTAQYINDGVEQDYAWYACFVPASATSKPIVVVVTVEQGGFGAVAAAPVAREILSQWFYGKPGQYTAGTSTDQ